MEDARIMIVDDEAVNIRLLEMVLERANFKNIRTTTDSRDAHKLFVEFNPDIVLLDLHMPELDGFAVMRQLKSGLSEGNLASILVLTADNSAETKRLAFAGGAKDFLVKPFNHIEVVLRIQNLLETHSALRKLQQEKETFSSRIREMEEKIRRLESAESSRQAVA